MWKSSCLVISIFSLKQGLQNFWEWEEWTREAVDLQSMEGPQLSLKTGDAVEPSCLLEWFCFFAVVCWLFLISVLSNPGADMENMCLWVYLVLGVWERDEAKHWEGAGIDFINSGYLTDGFWNLKMRREECSGDAYKVKVRIVLQARWKEIEFCLEKEMTDLGTLECWVYSLPHNQVQRMNLDGFIWRWKG